MMFIWICLVFCVINCLDAANDDYIYCYDCHYDPDAEKLPYDSPSARRYPGYPKCALYDSISDVDVDRWPCRTGKCFIRRDPNGLVYRGCADPWNLPWGVDDTISCKPQGQKPSLWWFCEGDTCNGGSFEHGDICAEDTYDEGIADQQLGYENTENDVYVETVHGAVARDSYGDNNKDFTGKKSYQPSKYESPDKSHGGSKKRNDYDVPKTQKSYDAPQEPKSYQLPPPNENYNPVVEQPVEDTNYAPEGKEGGRGVDIFGVYTPEVAPMHHKQKEFHVPPVPAYDPWVIPYDPSYQKYGYPNKFDSSYEDNGSNDQLKSKDKFYNQPEKSYESQPKPADTPKKPYTPPVQPRKSYSAPFKHLQPPKKSAQLPPPKSYEQPPQKSYQPPKKYVQPTPKSYKPPQKSYQTPEKSVQPPQKSYEPPQKSYQPPTKLVQPPQKSYEPPQKSYQPPKKSVQPPQKSYEPPQKSYQPPKKSVQPPQKSYEPPQKSYQPPKKSVQPPQKSYEPPQKSYQPPKKSVQPPQKSYEPPQKSYEPPRKQPQKSYDPPKKSVTPYKSEPPKSHYKSQPQYKSMSPEYKSSALQQHYKSMKSQATKINPGHFKSVESNGYDKKSYPPKQPGVMEYPPKPINTAVDFIHGLYNQEKKAHDDKGNTEPEKAGVYDKEIYDQEVKEGYNGYNNEVSDVSSEIYSYEVPYNQQQPEYESVAKAGYETYEQGYDTGYGSDGSYSDEGDENKGGEYVSQPTDDGYDSLPPVTHSPCDGACVNNPSGLFPHPRKDDWFIQCGNGMDAGKTCKCCKPYYLRCPYTLTFDTTTRVCSTIKTGDGYHTENTVEQKYKPVEYNNYY